MCGDGDEARSTIYNRLFPIVAYVHFIAGFHREVFSTVLNFGIFVLHSRPQRRLCLLAVARKTTCFLEESRGQVGWMQRVNLRLGLGNAICMRIRVGGREQERAGTSIGIGKGQSTSTSTSESKSHGAERIEWAASATNHTTAYVIRALGKPMVAPTLLLPLSHLKPLIKLSSQLFSAQ